MKKLALLSVLMCLSMVSALAQDAPQRREGTPPGDVVVGKVTAINSDSITIAPLAGGNPVTVKISDNTRFSKDRQPAKLSDIKTDETVFARGTMNGNSLDARMVAVVNPEMVQRMQQGGGMGMGGGMFNREDMGKKFIMGEVKAINETKLTIARPDNQTQDIEVDENTSFKRENESITLADVKVGSFVIGPGAVKDGVFVAKELRVGRPGMGMIMGSGRGQGSGQGQGEQKKPDADKPAPPKN